MNKVAVIGLGYVGLPLAVATVNAGYKTVGIDSNVFKIKTLSNMKSPIEDISDQQIFKISNSYWHSHFFSCYRVSGNTVY